MNLYFFFLKGCGAPRVLHSFPPRPSPDLADRRVDRIHVEQHENRAEQGGTRRGQPRRVRHDDRGRATHLRLGREPAELEADRKSTRLNSSHANISYAVFCLKKKNIWSI